MYGTKYSRFQNEAHPYRESYLRGPLHFLCVSYVLAVNPAILGAAGMDVGAVFTATAVSAIIMTFIASFV